jgi:hypothetical protein
MSDKDGSGTNGHGGGNPTGGQAGGNEGGGKGHDDTVVINVDGVDKTLTEDKWVVSELKAHLGIDPSQVLAEITPHGLNDLDENKKINLKTGDRFMTHARSGGSS